MRGLTVILGLAALKGLWMRFFLSKPERRNQVSAEAASKVRMAPDGAAQDFEYAWPKRKPQTTDEKD